MATDLIEQLKKIKYPGFSRDIVSFGLVKGAGLVDGVAKVTLQLTTNDPKVPEFLRHEVEKCLQVLPEVRKVLVEISAQAPASASGAGGNLAGGAAPVGIRASVAVGSGKGGVGKSTFAVNLACALAQILADSGRTGRVGLLDCDIYGPSIPLMMGISGRPGVVGEGAEMKMVPLENHGVKVMSIGFLVDDDTPVIWRGPMIMKTVQQFVQNVEWGDLDILLIDLPPGTGDAQLSLVQTLPLNGAIIVTTPQAAATNVARKGALMFQKVNVPLLGIAENMSYFVDPMGVKHHLFGEGGGKASAEKLNIPFLGEIPLLTSVREGGDNGLPIVVSGPDTPAGMAFHAIAKDVLGQLAAKQAT